MQSEEAVIPPEGSNVGTTDELHSKLAELEDKVKDLERKVANLFLDNVALKTKLEASQVVERQQQEEITRLKERLVQALRAHVIMHCLDLYCVYLFKHISCAQQDMSTQEQSLSRTKKSQLEEKIKVLEEERSDLKAEV